MFGVSCMCAKENEKGIDSVKNIVQPVYMYNSYNVII